MLKNLCAISLSGLLFLLPFSKGFAAELAGEVVRVKGEVTAVRADGAKDSLEKKIEILDYNIYIDHWDYYSDINRPKKWC